MTFIIDTIFTTFLVAFFALLTLKVFWPSKTERETPNNH